MNKDKIPQLTNAVLLFLASAVVFLSSTASATEENAANEETADSPGISIERWLLAGPLCLPAAAFADPEAEKPAEDLLGEALIDLDAIMPAPEEEAFTFAGKTASWKAVDAATGQASITAEPSDTDQGGVQVAYLAGYLETFQRGEVTVELSGTQPFVFYCDGKEKGRQAQAAQEGEEAKKVLAALDLTRGKHFFAIRTVSMPDSDSSWTIQVSFRTESDEIDPTTPRWSLDRVRSFTDLDEVERMIGLSQPALSPDGSLLALVKSRRKPTRATWIEIYTVPQLELKKTLRMGASTHLPRWSPDSRTLAFKSGSSLWCFTLADETMDEVLHKEKGLGWFAWAPDSRSFFFMTSGDKPESGDYERVYDPRYRLTDWDETVTLHWIDRAGKTRKTLTRTGEFALTQCSVSRDGKTLALVKRVPLKERPFFESEFWVFDVASGETRCVTRLRFPFENGPADLVFSPDNKKIAFTAPPAETDAPGQGPEHNAFDTCLFMLDLETGALERLSDKFDETVAAGLTWRREDNMIYFIAHCRAFRKIARIDPSGQDGLTFLDAPPSVVDSISVAAQADRIALVGSSLDTPRQAFVLDLNGPGRVIAGPLDPNAAFMTQIEPATWERFNVENNAGALIDGWIFYPPGFSENRSWPMVVYYYGGVSPEEERFSVLYYQWFPANGYVLYVVNPRGAVGYGRAFADAHCNDWGAGAGRDIIDGVKKVLKAKPFIDPDRIGAYGGSYGGFMTMSLVTECDLFKAACSMYGISNLASYWGGGIWGYTYGDTAMAGAYPWDRRDIFVDRSPLFKADKVRAALLLLHGKDDVNVPALESEQMFTAMKVLGQEVAYVRFPGEDHGIGGKFSNLKAHRYMILEWFDKHLKDEPQGWDARWQE